MADNMEKRAKQILNLLTVAIGKKVYPVAVEQCRELLICCASLCEARNQSVRAECPDPHRGGGHAHNGI